MIPVKIKRLRDDIPLPEYATDGAAGFDLIAAEDVIIEPGETFLVPTGLAIELPPGYELQIRPRSGISLRTKLRVANSPGTIDSDYRGEIGVIIDNIAQNPYAFPTRYLTYLDGTEERQASEYPVDTYLIHRGDRIAQGVIQRIERADFVVVDELTETERGEGGFGSTGTSGNIPQPCRECGKVTTKNVFNAEIYECDDCFNKSEVGE